MWRARGEVQNLVIILFGFITTTDPLLALHIVISLITLIITALKTKGEQISNKNDLMLLALLKQKNLRNSSFRFLACQGFTVLMSSHLGLVKA